MLILVCAYGLFCSERRAQGAGEEAQSSELSGKALQEWYKLLMHFEELICSYPELSALSSEPFTRACFRPVSPIWL